MGVSVVLVSAMDAGRVQAAVYQVPSLVYQQQPVLYHPDHLGVFHYPRGCVGIIGCLGQAINATNQGFITGAQGILQGGVAAGSGIANGVGTAVGGVASGLGQGVGGVASGAGAAIGGVASGTGQAISGAASGQPNKPRRVCVKTGLFSYYCYYVVDQ